MIPTLDRARRLVRLAAFVAIAFVLEAGCSDPARDQEVKIATATEGGTYIVIGRQMARILKEYPVEGISSAEALVTDGSEENIDLLLNSEAQMALVFAPTLASHQRRRELAALAVLYSDLFHIVVNKSSGIEKLRDLRSKRIFVGPQRSATRSGGTGILQSAGISESDYSRIDLASYGEASQMLREGGLDAAFFLTAGPAIAVQHALSDGCCYLLDLHDEMDAIKGQLPSLSEEKIAAHVYPNQPDEVTTVGGSALLVARKDMGAELISGVLNVMFDHISDFEIAKIRVQDIRLYEAFDLPEGIELHPGAAIFQDRERTKLWIATGVINGKYYELGKRLQQVLENRGIPSRAIHTDGSIENLQLLTTHDRTVAITQYDTALASIFGDPYGEPELIKELNIPSVDRLRRIVVLHEEMLHALIRWDRGIDEGPERLTLSVLHDARVCLGAPGSGTQVLAKVLLRRHGVVPKEEVLLSVPDMVARIHNGELDAGFFMSAVPSEALRTVVNDSRNRLLSTDPQSVAGLLGPAVRSTRIPPGTYVVQLPGEHIDTVSTWAVLVARQDLSLELVKTITSAIFETQDFLRIPGGESAMSQDLNSLELHPGALAYYQDADIYPSPDTITLADLLDMSWRALAILVILVGGYQGILKLRRDRTSNEIARRILAISVDAGEPDSVNKLLEIRTREIRERVRWRWWRLGELDKSRWRYLHDLINHRIDGARDNLTRAIAEELRAVEQETVLGDAARLDSLGSLQERVWRCFEKGELDASQHGMLTGAIRDSMRQITEATAGSPYPESEVSGGHGGGELP